LSKLDIFDHSSHSLLYKSTTNKLYGSSPQKLVGKVFFCPREVPRNDICGLEIKDGKGFISIKEVYLYKNRVELEKIEHVYKYITNEYIYTCKCESGNQSVSIPYNFHYDTDLQYPQSNDMKHPIHHLSVLHSHPRFSTGEMQLELFLEVVQSLCFDDSLKPFNLPIFSIG